MEFLVRRANLGLVAALLAFPVTSVAAQELPDLTGKTFVFASFGGDLQKNQDLAWLQPFAKATGVTIEQTDSPDLATLQTQQEAGNVGIDVLEIESFTVDGGCGTVFAKIDIDRSQINPAYDTNECGVPIVKFSFVLAYNAEKYPTPPTSVADFFNTTDFPGARGVANASNSGLIEAALQADGVEVASIYPIDLDRALAKVETIKADIIPVGTFSLLQDGLASGEYDMALIPNARAYNASKTNPNIKAVFNGAVTLYDNLAIPTGAKNLEAATAFLQYVARHDTQTALSKLFPYGVGTVGPEPVLDDQAKLFFPDNYTDQLLIQDSTWWSANDATVKERILAMFSQ